jgi:hypothetical protein
MAMAPQLRKQIPGLEACSALDAALCAYEDGDSSRLIDYLRSDLPLDRDLRDQFASHLEYLSKPKRTGRPRNYLLQDITGLADKFYREWKARNKRAGINDRGLSDNMKYQSCVYLIEMDRADWDESTSGKIPDPEAVMQLLTRPKSRRN